MKRKATRACTCHRQKKILKCKRSQMKIQQMAFMLMAVTLFFVLVGLFFLVFGFSNLKDSATSLREQNAMLLVTRLANSPEFSCGRAFDNAGTNCVDADKAVMMQANSGKYAGFWGEVTNIEIRKVYPVENDVDCNIGNYPNCNVIKIIDSKTTGYYQTNFVALCSKASDGVGVYDKCEIARLMVGYEEVE